MWLLLSQLSFEFYWCYNNYLLLKHKMPSNNFQCCIVITQQLVKL